MRFGLVSCTRPLDDPVWLRNAPAARGVFYPPVEWGRGCRRAIRGPLAPVATIAPGRVAGVGLRRRYHHDHRATHIGGLPTRASAPERQASVEHRTTIVHSSAGGARHAAFDGSMTPADYKVLLVDDDPAMLRLLSNGWRRPATRSAPPATARRPWTPSSRSAPTFSSPIGRCRASTAWSCAGGCGRCCCRITCTSSSSPPGPAPREMIAGLEIGADDFLSKPVSEGELLARMRSGSRVLELERRLSLMAHTDSLTGLMTQRSFYESLEKEWHRSRRSHLPLSCVMMDLDFFKQVNDVHGHPAGDSVLKSVAELLVDNCRASDSVCRYGGEEFCVMLPETSETRRRRVGRAGAAAAGRAADPRGTQGTAHHRQLRRGPVPRRHADLRRTGRSGRPGAAVRKAHGPRPRRPLHLAGRRRGTETARRRAARRDLPGHSAPAT